MGRLDESNKGQIPKGHFHGTGVCNLLAWLRRKQVSILRLLRGGYACTL